MTATCDKGRSCSQNPSRCGPYDQVLSNGPNACPPMSLKIHHGRMNREHIWMAIVWHVWTENLKGMEIKKNMVWTGIEPLNHASTLHRSSSGDRHQAGNKTPIRSNCRERFRTRDLHRSRSSELHRTSGLHQRSKDSHRSTTRATTGVRTNNLRRSTLATHTNDNRRGKLVDSPKSYNKDDISMTCSTNSASHRSSARGGALNQPG